METVLKIRVVFLQKDSFFATEKRNERAFNVHDFLVLKPRTLEQPRIVLFSVSCIFNRVVHFVDRIAKSDGLVDQSKMSGKGARHFFCA